MIDAPSMVLAFKGFGAAGLTGCRFWSGCCRSFHPMLLILIGLMVLGRAVGLPEAVLACTLGSVLGALCWYGLGNLLGSERSERAVDRFGKYVLSSGDTYQATKGGVMNFGPIHRYSSI